MSDHVDHTVKNDISSNRTESISPANARSIKPISNSSSKQFVNSRAQADKQRALQAVANNRSGGNLAANRASVNTSNENSSIVGLTTLTLIRSLTSHPPVQREVSKEDWQTHFHPRQQEFILRFNGLNNLNMKRYVLYLVDVWNNEIKAKSKTPEATVETIGIDISYYEAKVKLLEEVSATLLFGNMVAPTMTHLGNKDQLERYIDKVEIINAEELFKDLDATRQLLKPINTISSKHAPENLQAEQELQEQQKVELTAAYQKKADLIAGPSFLIYLEQIIALGGTYKLQKYNSANQNKADDFVLMYDLIWERHPVTQKKPKNWCAHFHIPTGKDEPSKIVNGHFKADKNHQKGNNINDLNNGPAREFQKYLVANSTK